MVSEDKAFDYSGTNELAVMEAAKNYNQSILSSMVLTYRSLIKADACLDFGAGSGLFADLFQQATSSTVYCVEPDPELVKKLSNRNESLKNFSDLSELPIKEFDFVYSLNVLEHIEDDLQALRALKKLLHANGRLFLYVPAIQYLFTGNDKRVGHFRRYSVKDLRQKLLSAGFKIESIRFRDQAGFFATLVYKWFLDNGSGAINQKSLVIFDRFVFPANRLLEPIFYWLFGKNLEVLATHAQRPS